MRRSLLEQFFIIEADPYVCNTLLNMIDDPSRTHARFEFNVFEITIEKETGVALLQDVLDATPTGTSQLPLASFAHSLRTWINEERSKSS